MGRYGEGSTLDPPNWPVLRSTDKIANLVEFDAYIREPHRLYIDLQVVHLTTTASSSLSTHRWALIPSLATSLFLRSEFHSVVRSELCMKLLQCNKGAIGEIQAFTKRSIPYVFTAQGPWISQEHPLSLAHHPCKWKEPLSWGALLTGCRRQSIVCSTTSMRLRAKLIAKQFCLGSRLLGTPGFLRKSIREGASSLIDFRRNPGVPGNRDPKFAVITCSIEVHASI